MLRTPGRLRDNIVAHAALNNEAETMPKLSRAHPGSYPQEGDNGTLTTPYPKAKAANFYIKDRRLCAYLSGGSTVQLNAM